jgi:peptide/nickel transport system permease protein
MTRARSLVRAFLKLSISLKLCFVVIFCWVFVAAFADFLRPHSALIGDLSYSLRPPIFFGGNFNHPFGTDLGGHDIFSQMIAGARLTLLVVLGALLIGAGIGTLAGLIAGYYGGWLDSAVMRLADFTFAFPVILGALLLAVVFGDSFLMVILIIGVLLWSRFARVTRAEVLSLRERDFVALARVAGASDLRILIRHLLPNVMGTVIVMMTLQLSQAILTEAALSFIGVGIPPPNPSWGAIVSEGRNYLRDGWWISFFPGMAIVIVVFAITLLGDWLRDRLDPHLRPV